MKKVNDSVPQVWAKGKEVPGKDKSVWRYDACGALIRYDDYGKQTEFGWEIDHIVPRAKGGSNDLSNLQPLQWINNRAKGDGEEIPQVVAHNERNIQKKFADILFE